MKIFVSGSLAYDRIMDFPEKFSDHILPEKIHILNVCFMVNGINEQFGGTAGNIAYNLRLLGESPLILSCAGKDFDSYACWLQDLGLSMEGIRRVEEEFTAGAYITTDKADNQITGFNPGAMRYPSHYEVDGCDPADTLAIVSPGNLDDMVAYSRCYKARGIPYIFDPGQSIPALSAQSLTEMLDGSKLFISNDYELEMVVRATKRQKTDLLDLTGAIITTLGDRGSIVLVPEGEIRIDPARARKVLDPTGAGDAFRAGLIKGLVIEKDLVDSCHMGSACASFSVECKGTQCHRFSMEEFWTRYDSMFSR